MESGFPDTSWYSATYGNQNQTAYARWLHAQKDLQGSPFSATPTTAPTGVENNDGKAPNIQDGNPTDKTADRKASFSESMKQVDQAIQKPGDTGQTSFSKNFQLIEPTGPEPSAKSPGQQAAGQGAQNTGATETSGTADSKDAETTKQKAESQQQTASANQEKQSTEAEGKKLQSDAEKNGSKAANAEQDAAGGKDESPGKALTRAIQETRRDIQDSPPDASPGEGRSPASSLMAQPGGTGAGNGEMLLNQAGQKAQSANQDHGRGRQMHRSGMMQSKKGTALQKSGDAQVKAGTSLSTAGQALVSSGQALLSNPFTAAIGAAMIASGTAMKITGAMLKATGKATKAAGQKAEQAGQRIEKDGQKMLGKAKKSAQTGHQKLAELRNRRQGQSKSLTTSPAMENSSRVEGMTPAFKTQAQEDKTPNVFNKTPNPSGVPGLSATGAEPAKPMEHAVGF